MRSPSRIWLAGGGLRRLSKRVDVDRGEFVGRDLDDLYVVMHLDVFAPVGGRAASGRDGRPQGCAGSHPQRQRQAARRTAPTGSVQHAARGQWCSSCGGGSTPTRSGHTMPWATGPRGVTAPCIHFGVRLSKRTGWSIGGQNPNLRTGVILIHGGRSVLVDGKVFVWKSTNSICTYPACSSC